MALPTLAVRALGVPRAVVPAAPSSDPSAGIGRAVTVPFVVTAMIAIVVGLDAVETADGAWLLAAVACSTLSGITLVLSRGLRNALLEVLPSLLSIAAVACIRHATGGATSPFASLLLLPVLWVAIQGDRRTLAVTLVAIAAVVALPAIVVGPPSYPPTELRRLLIFVAVAASVGYVVRDLVGRARTALEHLVASSTALADERDQTTALLDAASDAVVSVDGRGRIARANEAAIRLLDRPDLVGQDALRGLIAEADRDRIAAGFRRLLTDTPGERPMRRFEADLLRSDGTTVPAAIAAVRTRGADGPLIHAFVQDVRARRAAEQAGREHLDDLQALLGITRDLARSGTDGPAVVCATACRLSGADFAVLYIRDATTRRFEVVGSAGRPLLPGDLALDGDRSVAAMALREGRSYFIGDLTTDPRINQALVAQLGAGAAVWQPIRDLAGDGGEGGVLIAYWKQPLAELPSRTITLFELFAAQAAATMERAHLLGQLEALARTDALTGAANRRSLEEALDRATAEARRSGRPLAVVLLDLDHFKRYNDEHGHLAGDELLRAASAGWQRVLRPADTLARYGGEEFLAVLPDCGSDVALAVAARLRGAVPAPTTASAGVAVWNGVETPQGLVARADEALYRAKRAGRDRSQLWTAAAVAI